MSRYRLVFDKQETRIVPDLKSTDRPNHGSEKYWDNQATLEGDETVIAGALRAMANKIDPPKSNTRSGDY